MGTVATGGGGDLDVTSERRSERVVDLNNRVLLVGMEGGRGTVPDRAGGGSVAAGAGLELSDRPASGCGVTGEAAAIVISLGGEQRPAVALGELPRGDQIQRFVREL